MDERTMMEKIAGGDEAALHALLRQYGPLIRYILRPILTDERDREECYADISLKIWQTAGSFDGEKGTLKPWLTVLSRNAALNRARAKGTEDAPLEDTVPHGDGSAEDAAMGSLNRQDLFRRIHALPEKTREAVYLRLSGELPFSEIGAILGESETWARVTFYRAKQKLLEGGGV